MTLTKEDETIEEYLRRIEINPEVLMKILKWQKESNNMAGFLEEFGCKDWYEWGKLYSGVAQDAWKYHDLMKANSQVVKHNINITKEHQIVEGLKNKIKEINEGLDADYQEGKFDANADYLVVELQKLMEVDEA